MNFYKHSQCTTNTSDVGVRSQSCSETSQREGGYETQTLLQEERVVLSISERLEKNIYIPSGTVHTFRMQPSSTSASNEKNHVPRRRQEIHTQK